MIATSIPESLILTYAAALAGVVLVPVNPALPAGELRHVLGQSGAAGAFVVPEYRGHDLVATLAELRGDLPGLRHVVVFDQWDEFCSSASPRASPRRVLRRLRRAVVAGRSGRWRPTTWPSWSTRRGRQGRRRVLCSPTGA